MDLLHHRGLRGHRRYAPPARTGTVLEFLRERGRRGLPCDELYRQMFSKSMYRLRRGSAFLPLPGPTLLAQDTTRTTFMRYRWYLR
jgi:hypothetical protein